MRVLDFHFTEIVRLTGRLTFFVLFFYIERVLVPLCAPVPPLCLMRAHTPSRFLGVPFLAIAFLPIFRGSRRSMESYPVATFA